MINHPLDKYYFLDDENRPTYKIRTSLQRNIFLRFLCREGKKVSRKTDVKPYKSSYHWKVDISATPTQ